VAPDGLQIEEDEFVFAFGLGEDAIAPWLPGDRGWGRGVRRLQRKQADEETQTGKPREDGLHNERCPDQNRALQ
jgi:hypothetical protein